jgi:DNA helicase II / ATP-dependent DNA helicase PcrA
MGLTRSASQEAVLEWVRHGSGNAIVVAVAGSGKTTTLLDACQSVPASSRVLLLAFNKRIETEIRERIGEARNVKVQTFHAAGYSVLRSRLTSLGHGSPQSEKAA